MARREDRSGPSLGQSADLAHTSVSPHIESLVETSNEGDIMEVGEEEDEEDTEEEDDMEYLDIPDEFLLFPDDLPIGDKEFRHILFEGAHCLL